MIRGEEANDTEVYLTPPISIVGSWAGETSKPLILNWYDEVFNWDLGIILGGVLNTSISKL